MSPLSLEQLLASESFGRRNSRSSALEANTGQHPPSHPPGIAGGTPTCANPHKPKVSSARSARKLLNISGMFDSLDLSTNEEVHYKPTPHEKQQQLQPAVEASADDQSTQNCDVHFMPLKLL